MGTFNVNGRRPPADLDLRPWLDMANHQADIVAVGFQEVVPLNAGNVVMGMKSLSMLLCMPITILACMPMHRMVDTAACCLSSIMHDDKQTNHTICSACPCTIRFTQLSVKSSSVKDQGEWLR